MTEVTANDTERLLAAFKTWAGVDADPDPVTVKFYDDGKKQIGSTITLTIALNRDSVGNWHYDYTIPMVTGSIWVEFSGTLEGQVITPARAELKVSW